MARIPPLKRLLTEDFQDQSSWINKLLMPINVFMEQTVSALNKRLTIDENFAGMVKDIEVDGVFPKQLKWNFRAPPKSVVVGGWRRKDGTTKRAILTTTADTTSGSNKLQSVSSTTSLRPGLRVIGDGIPDYTYLTEISGTNVYMSNDATATATVSVEFSLETAVQVTWHYNTAGQLEIDSVTGIIPDNQNKYILTLECKTG